MAAFRQGADRHSLYSSSQYRPWYPEGQRERKECHQTRLMEAYTGPACQEGGRVSTGKCDTDRWDLRSWASWERTEMWASRRARKSLFSSASSVIPTITDILPLIHQGRPLIMSCSVVPVTREAGHPVCLLGPQEAVTAAELTAWG